MEFDKILQQMKMADKAIDQIKIQTRNFEQLMEQSVKSVPDADKQKVEEIRVLSIKAFELAKQGKGDEAQQLIKKFQDNGR